LLQVRVVQHGQVKRASRTRGLLPGDVLLLPKQLQQTTKHAESPSAAAASSRFEYDQEEVSMQWIAAQQQQQQLDPQLLQEQQEVEQQMEQELQQLEQQQQQQWQGDGLLQQQQQQQQQPGVLWQQRQQFDHTQQQQQQRHAHRHKVLTVQQVRKWVLASSADIAVLYKPPGVSFHQGSTQNHRALNPVLAEALNIRAPERPHLVCGLDDRASGCSVIARHAAADEWLSAWIAGEPAAVAAAAAMTAGPGDAASHSSRRGGAVPSRRIQQQQQKLQRIAAAAAAAAEGGKQGAAAAAAAGFAPGELRGMQQLLEGLGGLRLRRLFWAVVQADLPVRSSGTLRNRCAVFLCFSDVWHWHAGAVNMCFVVFDCGAA
jgi:hypothetical protein